MPKSPPKIGEYRHRPGAEFRRTPDGALVATRTRRRLPERGLVVLGYGVLGPAVCAAVTLVLKSAGHGAWLPRHVGETAVPRSPTLSNVLFGAGLPELVLTCALIGGWLWQILWRTKLPSSVRERGVLATWRALMGTGLPLGAVMMGPALLLASYFFFIRTAPAAIPWAVRPLFGLVAVPITAMSALWTGVIPLVLVLLGLLLGVVTALGVALLWQRHPEEPIPD